jgi:protein-S-isoprenylcysteine O-methyltransferase Ste14
LVFNLAALATFTPIVLYERSIDTNWTFWWQGSMFILQLLLLTVAFFLFLAGSKHYDFLQFLGIRQIRTGVERRVLTDSSELDMTGILGVMRHPWYVGGIMVLWARGLTVVTLITNLILSIYLVIGTYLEERKLVMEYGDEYRRYQEKGSMFIPYKFITSKIKKGGRH